MEQLQKELSVPLLEDVKQAMAMKRKDCDARKVGVCCT
jgi:hypothetical protein